jgi:predicted flap endonuclease-1-like 5' DNA nuclease
MIGDFLRKGFAWARGFFWVSDSDTDDSRAAKPTAPRAAGGSAKPQRTSAPASAPKSTGQRRSAEAKTSTNKRGTGAAKRTAAKGGAASKTSTAKSSAPKSTAPKSTGPGAPDADPAKPGDLSEIKGIGPAMKTKLAQLGIKSFADLAGADANQVAKSLDQRTITPERVRSWIAEAKKRS